MNKPVRFISSVAVILCCAATAMAQAGAPTQRVHIPGIPDGTSLYPKSTLKVGDDLTSIGCVSKTADGGFVITDWRGGAEASVAGAPTAAARPPMVVRLQSNKENQEMLNFHVNHEVQIIGPVVDPGDASHPVEIKTDSILYLSRTCWDRGTNTQQSAKKPKP